MLIVVFAADLYCILMVCFVGFLLVQSKIPRKGAILLKKFNDNADR